jgi:uncharacterized membrane protein YfcA
MDFLKKYRFHLLIGALAGAVNGVLGAGGGIIITYYLSHALTDEQKADNGVFANAVATMLPISVFSLLIYFKKGHIPVDSSIFSIVISASVGGLLGAILLTKLKLKTVKTIFSILVTVCGVMMILR